MISVHQKHPSATSRVLSAMYGSPESNQQRLSRFTSPLHVIHHGRQTSAGLSSLPTTKGHTHVLLDDIKYDLFSLDLDKYMLTMQEVYQVARILRDYYSVARCALAADGSGVLSVIPLHGLQRKWEPVTASEKEFHEFFPGYVSSKDGPQMDASRLEDICKTIQKSSGISAIYNCRFDGDQSDQNLFARIVRGQLPQSRVWENEKHVAFLTPFANTPGLTVLVPRTHLSSDIFGLDIEDYCSLVRSAYSVAQVLKSALRLRRCGMTFEGFEIDYAHIKLIPIHENEGMEENLKQHNSPTKRSFEENYAGYVTTQDGFRSEQTRPTPIDAANIRKFVEQSQSVEVSRS